MARRKKRLFPIALAIFAGVLIVASALALVGLRSMLQAYEACQPGHAVEAVIQNIRENAAAGTLWSYLDRPAEAHSRFDTDRPFWDVYAEGWDTADVRFSLQSGVFRENTVVYVVEKNGTPALLVELTAENTRTELLVFTYSDWRVEKLTPLGTTYAYSYTLRLPASFTGTVNGILLEESDVTGRDGDTVVYALPDMAAPPTFRITDAVGTEAVFDVADGVLTPVTDTFEIRLAAGFSLTANGTEQLPAETYADGTRLFRVVSAKRPEIAVSDAFGGSVPAESGATVAGGIRTVTVPEGYLVTVGNVTLDPAGGTKSANPAFPLEDLPWPDDLPALVTYTFASLDTTAVAVTDTAGKTETLASAARTTFDTLPATGGELPIDVLEVAETWSRFMTGDLEGKDAGLYHILPYIWKSAYLYGRAQRWANGVDHTLTSIHILLDPPFRGGAVTEVTFYSDRVFSCNVYLEKHMKLNSGLKVNDVLNSRFWFALVDGEWKLCAMQELLEGGRVS